MKSAQVSFILQSEHNMTRGLTADGCTDSCGSTIKTKITAAHTTNTKSLLRRVSCARVYFVPPPPSQVHGHPDFAGAALWVSPCNACVAWAF